MRQHHPAGEKLFVDYSGKKVEIVDPKIVLLHGRWKKLGNPTLADTILDRVIHNAHRPSQGRPPPDSC
jgi:hypothetical protein